ncbi:hypothetical protein CYLTODRAFT_427598 [Cylindrobasidium torrendii FP15055 ss-10]|uniref:Uncharacterized protein n=1 Tax=Cylindrobasidium torrendii FP15055 ss-10 TaxID=1314674 RepID=A0A0D7ASH2_9AGAR|nr:hypothetical protein CYLTODRAFT_427598 [Cylindrobasidium torrendii FP15055 ss-10]
MSIQEELKAEGNKFFGAKNYAQAIEKYSAAIQLYEAAADIGDHPKVAVLYANRAACYLNLKEYLSAISDAKQATEKDPKYVKAWARLAVAHDKLGDYRLSRQEWRRAWELAEDQGNTKLSSEYLAAVNNAERMFSKIDDAAPRSKSLGGQTGPIVHNTFNDGGRFPWVVAKEMIPSLDMQDDETSSAWVIHEAHEAFKEAVTMMFKTRKQGQIMMGPTGVIALLSSAIIQDNRCFHIDDGQFITKYNEQVIFECTQQGCLDWTSAAPAQIKKEALERLASRGWNYVRPSLALTIRGWIMRAFFEGGMQANHTAEIEFTRRAVELIEWGRKTWPNVSQEERGSTFERTFLRGVKNMLITALGQSGTRDTLEEYNRLAEEQVDDIDEHSIPDDYPPGFLMSFGMYCKGHAYAAQAMYQTRMSEVHAKQSMPYREKNFAAYRFYRQAAECFPMDDEHRAWFLSCAVQRMWEFGAPVGDQIDRMDELAEAKKAMEKLWKLSSLAKGGRDVLIDRALNTKQKWVKMLKDGEIKLDTQMGMHFE